MDIKSDNCPHVLSKMEAFNDKSDPAETEPIILLSKKAFLYALLGIASVCVLGTGCYYLLLSGSTEKSPALLPLKFKHQDGLPFAPTVIRTILHALHIDGNRTELNAGVTKFFSKILADPKSEIDCKEFEKVTGLDKPNESRLAADILGTSLFKMGFNIFFVGIEEFDQRLAATSEAGKSSKESKSDFILTRNYKSGQESDNFSAQKILNSIQKLTESEYLPIAFAAKAVNDKNEECYAVYLKESDGTWTMFDDVKNVTKTKISDKEILNLEANYFLFHKEKAKKITSAEPIDIPKQNCFGQLGYKFKDDPPAKFRQAFRICYEAWRRDIDESIDLMKETREYRGFLRYLIDLNQFPMVQDESKTLNALVKEGMKGYKISYLTVADLESSKTDLDEIQFIGIVSKAGVVDKETAKLKKICPEAVPIAVYTGKSDLFVKARDGTWTSINDYENKAILGLKEADIVNKKATYILYHNPQ